MFLLEYVLNRVELGQFICMGKFGDSVVMNFIDMYCLGV